MKQQDWQSPDGVRVPEGWSQGRALFGGLQAAFLYDVLAQSVPETGPVRSLTVSFVAPVDPAQPIQGDAEVFRQGKSVCQAQSRLRQGAQVVAVMLATFGQSRTSVLSVPAAPAPEEPPPEAGQVLPYLAGLVPEFTQQFDFRWTYGQLPFTGAAEGNLGGWMRLRQPLDPEAAISVPELLLLGDAWPPAIAPMIAGFAPVSSLTWTIELVPQSSSIGRAGDWFHYRAETERAEEGYCHARASIWTADGRLVALSRQTIAVFA